MAKKDKNLENIKIAWGGTLDHPEAGNQNQSIPASVDLGTWSGNPTTGYVTCWADGDYSSTSCQIENMYFEDFDVSGVGGIPDGVIGLADVLRWKNVYKRTDIQEYLADIIVQAIEIPKGRVSNYTWGDVSFVIEIADGLGTGSRRAREARLQQLDKDKKKRLIRLICRVKGEEVYDETKEVGDIQLRLDDVDMVINKVVGTMKVSTEWEEVPWDYRYDK